MAEAENPILEHLRHIRGQLDRMEHQLEEIIARLGHVERAVADHSVQQTEIDSKLNRLDARVTRIEKRLDIVEG